MAEAGCVDDGNDRRRFGSLRGVQWRIDLGILPSPSSSLSSSSLVDHIRRVTADSRRRYAGLRRRLLVDPHLPKDGSNSPDFVIDNPLSQNPDSCWGRFFRNAELEKTVDQDLSRLYPEHGSYFQTPGCQGILRRILLLWCLRYPECGYRQGMHELLAPLLYVLHVDTERVSEVRKQYEDHFTDKFDDLSLQENDLTYNFDFKKFLESMGDEMGSHGNEIKIGSLDELDPEIQMIALLSDPYGAEGELGIVSSEKFMEHDAYCMFDALMSGAHGSVAMADFFYPTPAGGSHSGLSPVIEASAAIYHLLSVVDSSLHSHLVELGVEPQYFALRWLRVLFGREFSLEALLSIWDVIFSADNSKVDKGTEDDSCSGFGIFSSRRGALISAMAVSMILSVRTSLLASENATTCLRRLLNIPENVDLKKLIDKAKSLQTLALEANVSSYTLSLDVTLSRSKSLAVRGHNYTLSCDSVSPKTPLNGMPDSYWEEKWRVLHKTEELKHDNLVKQSPTRRKGWTERVKLKLSRTESDPSPGKARNDKKEKSSVRRSLLEDLSRQLGLDEDVEKPGCVEASISKDQSSEEFERQGQDGLSKDFTHAFDEGYLTGNAGSEENSSVFSDPLSYVGGADEHENDSEKSSYIGGANEHENDSEKSSYIGGSNEHENDSEKSSYIGGANEHENDSEKSSVASNSSVQENGDHPESMQEGSPIPTSDHPDDLCSNIENQPDPTGKMVANLKERKLLLGKFQWLWKFGRNGAGEEASEKRCGVLDSSKSTNGVNNRSNTASFSSTDGYCNGKVDEVEQNVMETLRNLGQSMLEHIQVIESAVQPDCGQMGSLENLSKNVLIGKGQNTAIAALKELRKISNLLSDM